MAVEQNCVYQALRKALPDQEPLVRDKCEVWGEFANYGHEVDSQHGVPLFVLEALVGKGVVEIKERLDIDPEATDSAPQEFIHSAGFLRDLIQQRQQTAIIMTHEKEAQYPAHAETILPSEAEGPGSLDITIPLEVRLAHTGGSIFFIETIKDEGELSI